MKCVYEKHISMLQIKCISSIAEIRTTHLCMLSLRRPKLCRKRYRLLLLILGIVLVIGFALSFFDDETTMNYLNKKIRMKKTIFNFIGQLKKFYISSSPCSYPDEVDLRIIVIASNRPAALDILLQSLNKLKLDGAVAALDIWLDRDKENNTIHNQTLLVANNFKWPLGVTRVHIWPLHVGIYGQWIDTWCPNADSHEMALILEEDIVISPFAWRWLRAARDTFEARDDIAGYSLQSEGVFTSIVPRKLLNVTQNYIAFAYRVFGTWGFAPHPRRWVEFVSWYKTTTANITSSSRSSTNNINSTINVNSNRVNGSHIKSNSNNTFKPYVDKIIMTKWYQQHEKVKKQDTMWSMWFIYFTNKYMLFTVYNNLNRYIGNGTNYLSVHNSAYGGIHYKQLKSLNDTAIRLQVNSKLLNTWKDEFVFFGPNINCYDYNGTVMKTFH